MGSPPLSLMMSAMEVNSTAEDSSGGMQGENVKRREKEVLLVPSSLIQSLRSFGWPCSLFCEAPNTFLINA